MAVAATGATGALAFGGAASAGSLDETLSCPIAIQGGIPVVRISTHAHYAERNNGQMYAPPPLVRFSDRNEQNFVVATAAARGYGYATFCKRAARIPLTPGTLPKFGTYRNGSPGTGIGVNSVDCFVGARATLRMRVTLGTGDRPTAAQISLRTGPKLRPIAFVDWTPNQVVVYATDDCHL